MDKKEMKKEFADKFKDKYKDYDITETTKYWCDNGIQQEGIYLIIKNPNGEEDLKLMYDGNHVGDDEMILSYSCWHNHFFDYYFPEEEKENYADYFLKDVSEYIDAILQGKELETLL